MLRPSSEMRQPSSDWRSSSHVCAGSTFAKSGKARTDLDERRGRRRMLRRRPRSLAADWSLTRRESLVRSPVQEPAPRCMRQSAGRARRASRGRSRSPRALRSRTCVPTSSYGSRLLLYRNRAAGCCASLGSRTSSAIGLERHTVPPKHGTQGGENGSPPCVPCSVKHDRYAGQRNCSADARRADNVMSL